MGSSILWITASSFLLFGLCRAGGSDSSYSAAAAAPVDTSAPLAKSSYGGGVSGSGYSSGEKAAAYNTGYSKSHINIHPEPIDVGICSPFIFHSTTCHLNDQVDNMFSAFSSDRPALVGPPQA